MMKLTIDPKRLWFTSDSHYHHTNMCRGVSKWGKTDSEGNFHVDIPSTRDFPDLRKMNAALVDRINAVVAQDDVLIHCGDWSFGGQEKVKEFRDRIICQNIILIYGNHDGHIRKNHFGEQKLFKRCSDYEELTVNGEHKLVLFHYPIESWNGMHRDAIMLQGHQHLKGEAKFKPGKRMDVGACGNDLHPYSLEEILRIMKKRSFVPLEGDHHS
jgi:calcineurin-like phosphoesterase family protein